MSFHLLRTMPWLMFLIGSLSPQRCGFHPGSIYVRFVVDKMAVGWVVTDFFSIPCHYHSTNAPYPSSSYQ